MSSNAETFFVTSTEDIDQWAAVTAAGDECDAVGELCFGIAQQSVDSGDEVPLVISGRTKALVNANSTNISVGDDLSPSTTAGVLIKHDDASGTRYVARALQASTADGDVIEILLYDRQRVDDAAP
jgi:hypothetical protein